MLAKELEANYDRITTDLQVDTTEKFPVHVFADIDTFHQASGQRGAAATHVGTTQGIDTWLVSPLNTGGALDTQEVLTAGVHEFTHALVNYINGSKEENNYQIPIWLNEGLAGYEAQKMIPDWRARMVELVGENKIPSIANDLVPDKWEQVKGFPYSITLVEYMIEEYGFDRVASLLESPQRAQPKDCRVAAIKGKIRPRIELTKPLPASSPGQSQPVQPRRQIVTSRNVRKSVPGDFTFSQ